MSLDNEPVPAGASGRPSPLMPTPPERPASKGHPASDMATMIAMFAVFGAGMGILALIGFATMGLMFAGVLAVILGMGLMATLHYLTWGWWMSQLKDDDEAR